LPLPLDDDLQAVAEQVVHGAAGLEALGDGSDRGRVPFGEQVHVEVLERLRVRAGSPMRTCGTGEADWDIHSRSGAATQQ
jgi:hypothetical protein